MTSLSKILPPYWFMLSIGAMVVLRLFYPIETCNNDQAIFAGITIALFGLYIFISSVNQFRNVNTPVRPFTISTELVTDGFFRFSRNPMYVGLIITLLGIACELGNASSLLVIPIFFLILEFSFVRKEEELMNQIFGESYQSYRRRTRRWL